MMLIFSSFQFSSCSDDSITKKEPLANFTFNPNSGYAPSSVQFTSSSQNAVDFTWDFGDGSTSIAENPSHVFTQPGTYTVTLKVKNGDKQNQKSSQITILRPFSKAILTKVVLTDMPFLNPSGQIWDPFNGPDVFFTLLSPNPTNTILYSSGYYTDLQSTDLPKTWNLSPSVTITDFVNFHFIRLWDDDTIDADDKIADVSFKLDSYTTGSGAYPSSIVRTQNNATVVLHFTWVY
jgi:PKD repeat protein